ncbi:hypothetical protein GCM10009541_18690 [Micromonospora gifhornensis]|uniref:Uncharacterized protein n=1 Tax=Micromonospora gifhornensis TaxID=84594 RepID=A0ABQ4I9R4_9ACTN|nr:hypothetical protein Vgi01_13100 [Micromonospora gifhornensis]
MTEAAYAAGASHTAPRAAANAPTTDNTRALDRFMPASRPDMTSIDVNLTPIIRSVNYFCPELAQGC